MGSDLPAAWLRPATDRRAFRLPPGAEIAVQVGAIVHVGDTLASLPPQPQVIAVAESLRISIAASKSIIDPLDGTVTEAGATLGTHRAGFRTRSVPAPCSGKIRGISALGAMAIQPTSGRLLLRADRPGVVAEVDCEHIAIMSRAFVCRPAYILGAGTTIGRFSSATGGGHGEGAQRPATGGGDIVTTAIPFLATVAAFAAAMRSARGPMIVGTASEAVAWEILTAHATRGVPVEHSIAVLIGPGDDETGARVIAHLRRFDGAMFILDPSARALTFIPEQSTDGEWPDESHRPATNGARYRDPARWNAACVVEGKPQIGLIETGARSLIVRTGPSGDGRPWVPTDNIAIWPY